MNPARNEPPPPPEPLSIRRGIVQDAVAIAQVYIASRRHAGARIPRLVHTDDEVRAWFASIVLVEQEAWVAELGAHVIGMMVLRGDSLDQLYVAPEHQRRGVGTRLLGHAQLRRRRLRLFTFESNEPARSFYEKHGFRAIAFGDGTANTEGAPDVLYEWVAH